MSGKGNIMIRIALDGPSGAGKSTLAKEIAKRLGIVYLDTGALYRTVGLFAKKSGLALGADGKLPEGDAERLAGILGGADKPSIDVKLVGGAQHVILDGMDVGDSIRTPEMSLFASAVSRIQAVRDFLLDVQRDFAKKNSVIMDGRDIGTVILPDADVKIFLTASDEVRAKRRLDELTAKGISTTFEDVLSDMRKRDENDRTRKIAPAVPAEDAVILDNSALDFAGTVDEALRIIDTNVKKG